MRPRFFNKIPCSSEEFPCMLHNPGIAAEFFLIYMYCLVKSRFGFKKNLLESLQCICRLYVLVATIMSYFYGNHGCWNETSLDFNVFYPSVNA